MPDSSNFKKYLNYLKEAINLIANIASITGITALVLKSYFDIKLTENGFILFTNIILFAALMILAFTLLKFMFNALPKTFGTGMTVSIFLLLLWFYLMVGYFLASFLLYDILYQ